MSELAFLTTVTIIQSLLMWLMDTWDCSRSLDGQVEFPDDPVRLISPCLQGRKGREGRVEARCLSYKRS